MMKKAFAALALTGSAMSAHATVLLQQGFDDVPALATQGWVFTNASAPAGGIPGWFQGDQGQFGAQAGNPGSYAAANFNNAGPGGLLDNWLITPSFDASRDVIVSFWLRAGLDSAYSDQVRFGFSNGDSAISAFKTVPAFTVPTSGWTYYTATLAAQGAGSTARFGIDYTGAADSANYVGLDTLRVDVPEPASALLVVAGLLGLRASRRRA